MTMSPLTRITAPKQPIHVVAAVILDHRGSVLIAKRPADKHMGGLWEFPGGKREPGEAVEAALQRELNEELGICAQCFEPFLTVHHDYRDKSVLLDIWRITAFTGEAHGRENQEIKWVPLAALRTYQFPAANEPIIERLLSG